MPERIAKVQQEYKERPIGVGEVFDVETRDVGILLAVGYIEPEKGEPGYTARDLTADVPPAYLTRDMQAVAPRRGRPRKDHTQ